MPITLKTFQTKKSDTYKKKKNLPIKQSANNLTKAILGYIHLKGGYKVWRQNNVGIYDPKIKRYRNSDINQRGVGDIIGYQIGTGRFISIEVKANNDKMSPHQIEFRDQLLQAGGIYIEARSIDDFIEKFSQITK